MVGGMWVGRSAVGKVVVGCVFIETTLALQQITRINNGIQLLTETEFMHIQFPQNNCACIFPLLHTPACGPVRSGEVICGSQSRFAAGEIDLVFYADRDAVE